MAGQTPIVSSDIDKAVNAFIPKVVGNAQNIKLAYFNNYEGKPLGPIKRETVIKILDNIIIPSALSWQNGWSDDATNTAGPSMAGVTLAELRANFDTIFKSGVDTAAVTAFNNALPTWKTDRAIGCQVLFKLLSVKEIQDLFFYQSFCSKQGAEANLVATVDPWFAAHLFGSYWSGDATFYYSGYAQVARTYGYVGPVGEFGSFVSALKDISKITQFSAKCFTSRLQYVLDLSKPGSKQESLRKPWMDSLVFGSPSSDSTLDCLIRIFDYCTELSSAGLLSQDEINQLTLLKAHYEKIVFVIPE